MKHSDFALGTVFWSSDRRWLCTNVGTRLIVAIRIDTVEIGTRDAANPSRIDVARREAAGAKRTSFTGPRQHERI